jgi:hypothetical protein
MRASKLKHLRSQNSEDAVAWNVFRSLRQIDPVSWLPPLAATAFPDHSERPLPPATVSLWVSAPPPPSLLTYGDEGVSEIDVAIESPTWVWFVEAKHHSDISTGTTTRPDRDQVLRNVDVGTYYAGVRAFYFSLLIGSPKASRAGVEAVDLYKSLEEPRRRLAGHRADGLQNLRGISHLTWSSLADALQCAVKGASREDERNYASRALEWLSAKSIAPRTA